MAYTSTSIISSSVWYGPNSCPIISPSRWQTQILNNLCVLALHDHSASAGEGASTLSALVTFPAGQQEIISPYFPSGSTNWVLENNTSWPGAFVVSTSTNGASISYNVYLGTGLHTVNFYYGRGSAFGIITACLTGGSNLANPSSIDGYVSGAEVVPTGASSNSSSKLATLQFRVYSTAENTASGSAVTGSLVGSGKYTLTLKVSGSNANSAGYIARLGYIKIN